MTKKQINLKIYVIRDELEIEGFYFGGILSKTLAKIHYKILKKKNEKIELKEHYLINILEDHIDYENILNRRIDRNERI